MALSLKKLKAYILVLIMSIASLSNTLSVSANESSTEVDTSKGAETSGMSIKQLSSISMLNHMTVLSQEINASANSRIYLDNAYNDIVNNINPNAVDEDSMVQIRTLLNTIYAYQSIQTKRERLQYIYEQNQANAAQKAIPNPMSVLNVVQSGNPAKALLSIVYLAVDSADSYKEYLNEVDKKYLEDGWVLDDSAAENLHESRTDAFQYMVEMCQKNNLNGKLALNEKSVDSFVSWENNTNVTRRIDFLEENQTTYSAYGKYWLVLAESYYEKNEYQKCLDAIQTYEDMHIDTFRKDHDLAKTLSVAIAAAGEVLSDVEYISKVEHYLDIMQANIEPEDWLLRYVAAQTYMDLFSRSNNPDYLNTAYDLAETNVNYLIDIQHDKNQEYLADIVKEEAKKGATKAQKKEVSDYNKWIEAERKVALPPVYQPLVLNCNLLFGLAEEMNIPESRKQKLMEMLHSDDEPLFLVRPLENKYYFDKVEDESEVEVSFTGKSVKIPVVLLEQGTIIRVTVREGGEEKPYEDWTIDKVDRAKKSNVSEFIAVYESKDIKKQKYSAESTVKVEIIPPEESNYSTMVYDFRVNKGKKLIVLDDIDFELVK